MLGVTDRLKILSISYFSRPAHNRPVYQAIRSRQVRSILELGVGTGQRAKCMIEVARSASRSAEIRYTGIDLFEDRTAMDGPGLTLKMAHCLLAFTGARVRLIPGDPLTAMARTANSLGATDLVVVSARHQRESLARAWFYLPRVLGPKAQLFLEEPQPAGRVLLRRIPAAEIDSLAAAARIRRAA